MRRRIPSPYQNTDKLAEAGLLIIQNYKKKDHVEDGRTIRRNWATKW